MPYYKPLIFGALLLSMSASYPMAASGISAPDSITLNAEGQLFKPFAFDHAKHIEMIRECADCHHHTTGTLVLDQNCVKCHKNSSATAVVSCRGCHSPAPFSPETLAGQRAEKQRYHLDRSGLKGAMHKSCIGCHAKQGAGPVGCQDCHPRSQAGDAFYSAGRHAAKPARGKHGH